MRIDVQPFRGQVQPPFKLEWPARSALRQQVPAVDVLDVESSINVEILQGPSQTRARRNQAMHADVAAVDQADHLVHRAWFQLNPEIELVRRPP
jgi:hypothetical protein